MEYFLRSCFLENTHVEPIHAERFDAIKNSRKVLAAALEVENVFDQLISNYLDVESRCLNLTARRLVRKNIGYREGNEALAEINLAFVNYLSTARAYVDKIARAAGSCYTEQESFRTYDLVKKLLSEQYDTAFGFRFMEALRNFVQHSGSALYKLSQGLQKINAENLSQIVSESFLIPLCLKAELERTGRFKSQVLAECPDEINLLECARAHVHGLSHVQQLARRLIKEAVSEATHHLKEGQASLSEKVTGTLEGTEAVAFKDGEEVEVVPMILSWEDVRGWLVQRNPGVRDGIPIYPSGRVNTR